ncbi:MAG: M48 family metallopeptidase, partial [Terrimicrobiaceae bacterium]
TARDLTRSMDFFEKQELARRRTKWLVVYFVLAILGIVAALHFGFCAIFGQAFDDWEILGVTAAGVIASVGIASLVKIIQLAKGGKAVAEMLGGIPIDPATTDPSERRLRNVVEEMSLASGVPVPSVYLLDEESINAFAAGYGPTDAAIGVTRGCIENLTRDELQGVVAHEFSHILNGDMRLNIRLMGLLSGILFLAVLGGILVRIAASSPRNRSNNEKNGASLVALLLGAGAVLYLVGWIGVFFSKLIQAAVSRQREFLADASAVQFTRNPHGIAGALAKIGNLTSRLQHPRAREASHMFFGNGLAESWFNLFATHPPIKERIAQIAPDLQLSEAAPPPLPENANVNAAASMLSNLPDGSLEASRETQSGRALVFALLASGNDAALQTLDPSIQGEVLGLIDHCGPLSSAQKLALVDLAIPALRGMSREDYQSFRLTVKNLVEADGQVHLFEYTLQKLLVRHLDAFFEKPGRGRVQFKSIVPLLPDAGILFSALANADDTTAEGHEAAFHAGLEAIGKSASAFPMSRLETVNLVDFDKALDRFAEASPAVKKEFLAACGAVVVHDGVVNDTQFELLRAMADTMDCPMPPSVKTE